MDSFSKIPLNAAVAAEIVAYHFGSSTRLTRFEELKEGFFNAAALLELSDGREQTRLVLKAAPPAEVRVLRYERELLRAEVEAMRLLAAQTEVPVPAVRIYDPTCRLLPSPFFAMDYLPGVPYHKLRQSLSAADQAHVEIEMGQLTRAIGAVTGPAFGYWAQPCAAGVSWRECFAAMVKGVLQDGQDAGVDLGLPYAEIYRRMEMHFDTLDTVQTPRLVHWDLWDGNIFVDPRTLRVSGLIDFERALWGDPLIEAVFGDIDGCKNALAGYGEDLLAAPGGRTRRLLYNVYLHLIMVIECTYRRYPTPDQENWVRPVLEKELLALDQ